MEISDKLKTSYVKAQEEATAHYPQLSLYNLLDLIEEIEKNDNYKPALQALEIEPKSKTANYAEKAKKQKVLQNWNQLKWTLLLYQEPEKIIQSLISKNQNREAYSFHQEHAQLKRIEAVEISDWEISNDDKSHLKNLIANAQQVILYLEEFSTEPVEQKNPCFFNRETKILHPGHHKVKFERDGLSIEILALFTSNDKTKNQKWSWDVVYEELEEKEPPKNNDRKKVYKKKLSDSYRYINWKVSKETQNNKKFLIGTINSRYINPHYLKT